MLKVLIPVDDSRNCRFAVRHVITQFMSNAAMEVHLLNVQPPFSRYIAQFTSNRSRKDYHRDQAEKALGPIKQMLDGFSIPYSAHAEVGDKAKLIAGTARRLRCDRDCDEHGAQELADPAGREFGHQPGDRADHRAG